MPSIQCVLLLRKRDDLTADESHNDVVVGFHLIAEIDIGPAGIQKHLERALHGDGQMLGSDHTIDVRGVRSIGNQARIDRIVSVHRVRRAPERASKSDGHDATLESNL
jgi:hypothetical protein